MKRKSFLLAVLLVSLVPALTFGEWGAPATPAAPEAYWPRGSAECDSYMRSNECHYLLCLCYVSCNTDTGAIDLRRKNLCDGQFARCVSEVLNPNF